MAISKAVLSAVLISVYSLRALEQNPINLYRIHRY